MAKSIGVAIPCYEPHHHFINGLIDNAIAQTRKPDRVVISCSSWKQDARKDMLCNGIPVTVLYWKRRIVQAENRNIAATELRTDYVTFIDADDIMHPRRIEYILKAFQETNCDAVVHDYHYVKRSLTTPFDNEEYNCTNCKLVPNPDQPGCMIEGHQFHHAHVSVTNDVFQKLQFPIDEKYYRIEDSVYIRSLLENGVDIQHLSNKLSQYRY